MNEIILKIVKNLRVADARCPKGHTLMAKTKKIDGELAVELEVRHGGRTGVIWLNPFYGRFEYESELPLRKGDVVDLSCPECGVSLVADSLCPLCRIPMFSIQLPDGGQVEACPKVGCHKHSLTIVDLDAQLARMYVDETKFQM